ncbi:MAG: nucleotide exchange factor GrpE [Candidatus Woesearchaeota archaeon]
MMKELQQNRITSYSKQKSEQTKKIDKKEIDSKEIDSLQKQIDEKEEKIKEYIETLQRLQAEFENFKKREEKDKKENKKYSNAEFIKKLLPVIDSFEIALKNSNNIENFRKGIELIYSQLISILKEQGLRKIESYNQEFDPYKHEVILIEDSEKKEGTILEELQTGYMLNDMVIRHSKVKIAKNKRLEEKEQNKNQYVNHETKLED